MRRRTTRKPAAGKGANGALCGRYGERTDHLQKFVGEEVEGRANPWGKSLSEAAAKGVVEVVWSERVGLGVSGRRGLADTPLNWMKRGSMEIC